MRAAILALSLVACGGSSADVGAPAPQGDAGASAVTDGPTLTLAVRGSTAAVPHTDDLSGETPLHQIAAIKSLVLYRTPDDANPVTVFDLGDKAVEADYVSGQLVDIATVPLKSIPSGTYTYAKVGTSYVKYTVASRLHTTAIVDGQYANIEALSDGAVIDGVTRKKGWYRFQFEQGSTVLATVEGDDAPIPQVPAGGGITLETSGSESYYAFPTLVVIDDSAAVDERAICDVNVHESFRWMDEELPGYEDGVYDTTPTSYEPVVSFGANSFALSIGPK